MAKAEMLRLLQDRIGEIVDRKLGGAGLPNSIIGQKLTITSMLVVEGKELASLMTQYAELVSVRQNQKMQDVD